MRAQYYVRLLDVHGTPQILTVPMQDYRAKLRHHGSEQRVGSRHGTRAGAPWCAWSLVLAYAGKTDEVIAAIERDTGPAKLDFIELDLRRPGRCAAARRSRRARGRDPLPINNVPGLPARAASPGRWASSSRSAPITSVDYLLTRLVLGSACREPRAHRQRVEQGALRREGHRLGRRPQADANDGDARVRGQQARERAVQQGARPAPGEPRHPHLRAPSRRRRLRRMATAPRPIAWAAKRFMITPRARRAGEFVAIDPAVAGPVRPVLRRRGRRAATKLGSPTMLRSRQSSETRSAEWVGLAAD